MPRTLRYTTFAPGELEARLRELAPKAEFAVPLPTSSGNGNRLKAHTFAVRFPDGKEGTCRYERGGPRWHLFWFTYGDGTRMPRQVCTERMGNDPTAMEARGRELASACYREAMALERKDRFQRASEYKDGSRKKHPALYRMKAAHAKQQAGKYALCQRSGEVLFVVGPVRDTLEAANADWRERHNPRLVVGCCCRLDRCWQLPKFNLLYAECDPRPEWAGTQGTDAAGRTDGEHFRNVAGEPKAEPKPEEGASSGEQNDA